MNSQSGAPTSTPRLARSERRTSILDGAARVFARGGYAASAVADIAAEVGVSHLIIYRHFASKHELYEQVLARALDRLTAALDVDHAVGTYGPTTTALLGAARRDPAGFVVLWRHAAREPEFASWTDRARLLLATSTERALAPHVARRDRRWAARATTVYLVESVLVWMEDGSPRADARFIGATDAALRAGVKSWAGSTRRVVG